MGGCDLFRGVARGEEESVARIGGGGEGTAGGQVSIAINIPGDEQMAAASRCETMSSGTEESRGNAGRLASNSRGMKLKDGASE